MSRWSIAVITVSLLAIAGSDGAVALAESEPPVRSEPPPPEAQNEAAQPVVYKPPLRGAPGGRVGGASRAAVRTATPLPRIEPLAPVDHAGVTAEPSPVLYYFTSSAVSWPTQFTISAPMQPAPVLEVSIPSPPMRGLYALRLSDYGVRLQPGVDYTWSVAILINPHAWSRNIVGSAAIVFDPIARRAAPGTESSLQLAAILANAGIWYDAVAAAVAASEPVHGAALAALIKQVGLSEALAEQ